MVVDATGRRLGEKLHRAIGGARGKGPMLAAIEERRVENQAERTRDSVFQNQGGAGRRYRNIAGASRGVQVYPNGDTIAFEYLAALVPPCQPGMARWIGQAGGVHWKACRRNRRRQSDGPGNVIDAGHLV